MPPVSCKGRKVCLVRSTMMCTHKLRERRSFEAATMGSRSCCLLLCCLQRNSLAAAVAGAQFKTIHRDPLTRTRSSLNLFFLSLSFFFEWWPWPPPSGCAGWRATAATAKHGSPSAQLAVLLPYFVHALMSSSLLLCGCGSDPCNPCDRCIHCICVYRVYRVHRVHCVYRDMYRVHRVYRVH